MSIVTDGLVGYWHFAQGVSGSTWENIAPATKGQYNGTINGVFKQSDGMYFDGVDDKVVATNFSAPQSITVDLLVKRQSNKFSYLLCFDNETIGTALAIAFASNSNALQIYYGINTHTGTGSKTTTTLVPLSTFAFVTLTFQRTTGNAYLIKIYVDSVFKEQFTSNPEVDFLNYTYVTLGMIRSGYSPFQGGVAFVRLYNRELSASEVLQNYQNGSSVGLDSEPPVSTPPAVTIVSTSRSKLSDEVGMNQSIITFKFDQDVTEWRVRVLGIDPNTGTLADSGGAVAANTNITASVEWNELYQEGQNRINIYGKGKDGSWTAYSS
ncbi:hypothetical protein J1P26_22065 [Neobacillus sp. MM2021_6]|uniref:LamG domain-containing protein n=1 Tax=Bacillaceae TaxID=186817 RepID=UPI001408F0DA|nr:MULTISPECIES: LamG domain-containing protein [Bacillaceae]MBO0962391.1 hypothetical protein [Neobacillus sp. MM2021_6]NHC21040.1 LamG domain-containing protein [Bacillus sp. MM2020_4]